MSLSEMAGIIQPNLEENYKLPDQIFYIFTTLITGCVAKFIEHKTNFPIPKNIFILSFGIAWGIASNYLKAFENHSTIVNVPVNIFAAVFLPTMAFNGALQLDAHSFLRSFFQILIIGLPVFCTSAVFNAIILGRVLNNEWSIGLALIFGCLTTHIYPHYSVKELRKIGNPTRHVCTILEGEFLIGITTLTIFFDVTHLLDVEQERDHFVLLWVISKYLIGGMIFGVVIGSALSKAINILSGNTVNVLVITLVCPYTGYYLCNEIQEFQFCGIMCIVIIGFLVSKERSSLPSKLDETLIKFWSLISSLSHTIVFMIVGTILGKTIVFSSTLFDLIFILSAYLVAIVGRFISYFLFLLLLRKVGPGFDLPMVAIMIWSGLQSPASFCYAFFIYAHDELYIYGQKILLYISGLVMLTYVFNKSTLRVLLKVLGLSQLTLARQTNMNICLKYILKRRNNNIEILKMDRMLSDANWPMVYKETILKHPYVLRMDYTVEEAAFMENRITFCPDCLKEVPKSPTAKEFKEMTKEARLRLLKAKKISYSRQFENGMLTKEAARLLTQFCDVAMDSDQKLIELDVLIKMFQKESFDTKLRKKILRVIFKSGGEKLKQPRKRYRQICYTIVNHRSFQIVIFITVFLAAAMTIIEFFIKNSIVRSFSITFSFVVLILLTAEFILTVLGFSFVYIFKDGVRAYFKVGWCIFDFIMLCSAFIEVGFIVQEDFYSYALNLPLLAFIRCLRLVRFVKLVKYFKKLYPTILRYCDNKVDSKVAFAYDVGKGFVTGEEEVLQMLDYMIDNKDVRDNMRQKMETDKRLIIKEIGMVQKFRPWIAITVKTKQAMTATLKSMFKTITELKASGWIDEVEFQKLLDSLEERKKFVSRISLVEPTSPKILFYELPWISDQDNVTEFLYRNVASRVMQPGEVVVKEGQYIDGIYVVITGLLKISFFPNEKYTKKVNEIGELPIIDQITAENFSMRIEELVVSGNSIGELAVLTKRPYSCTIVAEAPSQLTLIPLEVINKAFEFSKDPVRGLANRMWKSACLKLVISILMRVPFYQSLTVDKIKFNLERAFVPTLNDFETFLIVDDIEDVILLEGVVADQQTKEHFFAPCYIPRRVKTLVLPKSGALNVEVANVRLMILPGKETDEYDLMVQEQELCKVSSNTSYSCLLHTMQNNSKRYKKKRNMGLMNFGRKKRAQFNNTLMFARGSKFTTLSTTALSIDSIPTLGMGPEEVETIVRSSSLGGK